VSEISIFSPLKDKLRQRKPLWAISVKELLNLDSLTRKHIGVGFPNKQPRTTCGHKNRADP
jgi:hypothetical protein